MKKTPHNQIKQITILFAIVIVVSSCRLIYNIPDISDYKIFPYRIIKHSPESVFYFERTEPSNESGKVILVNNDKFLPNVVTLDDYITESKTAAFLIIRNDTVLYEKYTKDHQENSIFNTFSVTKVFITTLIGIAIDEGTIKSVDQVVTEYIPELLEIDGFDKITIRQLLLQTSGIKFSNSRNGPFSDNAKYYYGRNLRKLVLKSELDIPPGKEINYGSANLQLLALILERATGNNISSYLQDKLWQKIGMQYDATWSLDNKRENSIEKGFSCLNCTAVDLAKLGRLYLNDGVWDDQQILSKAFIDEAIKRDTTDGSSWNFQYNFRLGPEQYASYYARGLFGQLIYIYPKKNMIIVHIGEADLKYNPQLLNYNVIQIIDQL